jgi:DNA end-binding protein Ku
MPRSLWTGSLSFGLVNVPVQLVSAVRDQDLHFRQLHAKDNAPIEQQRWCSEEDTEVPWEEIEHGYEVSDSKQVVITDEELALVEPRKTRTIDIERFVDLAEVDPILFDHPYWIVPGADNEGALRAYRLLVEVMGSTDRAAMGRFVLRAKEKLAVVRVRDGLLSLATMRFADEIRPLTGVKAPSGKTAKPTPKQVTEAVKLIEALATDWDPSNYEDRYRKRLQKVVRDKQKGKTISIEDELDEPKPVPDLMKALEASLAAVKKGEKPDREALVEA